MPDQGGIPYYPAFPPAIREGRAGCIRATHPSATLAPPKGRLPFDLHVLGLPLAFILSQDQTLRCTIVLAFFCSVSRVRLHATPLPGGRCPSRPASRPDFCSVLASSCQRAAQNTPRPNAPTEFCGCKSTTFNVTDNEFFQEFFIIYLKTLKISLKKITHREKPLKIPADRTEITPY